MKKITSIALLFMLATISMTAQNVIDIVYNGNQATVNLNGITDVTSTVSGAHVTIKSKTTSEEYTYRVSGTSTVEFTSEGIAAYSEKKINVLSAAYDAENNLIGVRSLYTDFYPRLDITVYSAGPAVGTVRIFMEVY